MSPSEREARAEADQDWRRRVALGILTVAIGITLGLIVFAGAVVASVLDWG